MTARADRFGSIVLLWLVSVGCGPKISIDSNEDGAGTSGTPQPTGSGLPTTATVTGTPSTTQPDPSSASGTTTGPGPCLNSTDCPPGFDCIAGQCVEGPCPSGCTSGGPVGSDCVYHDDCNSGEACRNGFCEQIEVVSGCDNLAALQGLDPIPIPDGAGSTTISLTFTKKPIGGPDNLVILTETHLVIWPVPLTPGTALTVSHGGESYFAMQPVDFDNDGVGDIVLSGGSGTRLYRGDGTGALVDFQDWQRSFDDIVVASVDAIPGDDLVGINYMDSLWMLSLSNAGIVSEASLVPNQGPIIRSGRVFGVGYEDVVIAADDGIRVWAGDPMFGAAGISVAEQNGALEPFPVLLDYDGDTDDDVVAISIRVNDTLVASWRNDPGDLKPVEYRSIEGLFGPGVRHDVEADGVDELLLPRLSGAGVGIVRFSGGIPTSICELDAPGDSAYPVAAGDLDGDGIDEIATVSDGQAWVQAL